MQQKEQNFPYHVKAIIFNSGFVVSIISGIAFCSLAFTQSSNIMVFLLYMMKTPERSLRKQWGGIIAVTAVGQKGDDDFALVFGPFCQFDRPVQSGS